MSIRRILVGEGSAEPVRGLALAAALFASDPCEFVFGVRRSDAGLEALDRPGCRVLAAFPGRGLARYRQPIRHCNFSAWRIDRVLATGRLRPDALVAVARPPAPDGSRSLGTVNGCMQAAIDAAPLVIVEEDPDLPEVGGAARIPAGKPVRVLAHEAPAYRALSRPADAVDRACAQVLARLIPDGATLQLGVGGPIEALAPALVARRGLRIVTGALGATVRALHEQGCLREGVPMECTALVGDAALLEWAARTPALLLGPSARLHDARWLARLPCFWSVNVALGVDLAGNVNAEWAGARRISGRGGAPDFARGARRGAGGNAVVVVRADRGATLVERVPNPSIPACDVAFVVCERGVADLRGKSAAQRATLLADLLS